MPKHPGSHKGKNATKGSSQFMGGSNKTKSPKKGNSTKGAEAFRGQRGTT